MITSHTYHSITLNNRGSETERHLNRDDFVGNKHTALQLPPFSLAPFSLGWSGASTQAQISFPTASFLLPQALKQMFPFLSYPLCPFPFLFSTANSPVFQLCPNKWLAINRYWHENPRGWGKVTEKSILYKQEICVRAIYGWGRNSLFLAFQTDIGLHILRQKVSVIKTIG